MLLQELSLGCITGALAGIFWEGDKRAFLRNLTRRMKCSPESGGLILHEKRKDGTLEKKKQAWKLLSVTFRADKAVFLFSYQPSKLILMAKEPHMSRCRDPEPETVSSG